MRTAAAPTLDLPARLRQGVAAALERKAADLKVLWLRTVSDFTDYFLLCSGASDRQVRSIAEAVEERLREAGVRPLHVEGVTQGSWVLLDYGDLVVHVFREDQRRYYNLERLWSDAPDVTAEFRR